MARVGAKMTPEYQRGYRMRRKAEGRPLPSGGAETPEKKSARMKLYRSRHYVKVREAKRTAARRLYEPEKIVARRAVRNAIWRGDLLRLPCEQCQSPKSQAHHADYTKPLVVRWLCQPHHLAVHRAGKGEVHD